MCRRHNLHIAPNHEPTFVCPHGDSYIQSCIDYILLNRAGNEAKVQTEVREDDMRSDHHILSVILSTKPTPVAPTAGGRKIPSWKMKDPTLK